MKNESFPATQEQIFEMVKCIAESKMVILDNFCKSYLAANIDLFLADPKLITQLELVEKRTADGAIYSFRIKEES